MSGGDTDDFDWSANAECTVIHGQPAIACYENPFGGIVIRQEGQYHPDEDQFIHVRPENVPALVDAMQRIARELLSRGPRVPESKRITEQRSSCLTNGKAQLEAFLGGN